MIGILGGTFDPIHHGHLRLALELYERLELQQVRLLPSARPPHREAPTVTPEQRMHMLRLALADEPALCADDRELRRTGPSYMVDSLSELRAEYPGTPLCLLLGMDAFLGLPTWHQWPRLIELAHLVVVQRPDTHHPLPDVLSHFVERYRCHGRLQNADKGRILMLEIPALSISATYIRSLLHNGRNPRYLLPPTVLQFILDQRLYQMI
jgi:nicotinate-nucleotide adenylyltransferase